MMPTNSDKHWVLGQAASSIRFRIRTHSHILKVANHFDYTPTQFEIGFDSIISRPNREILFLYKFVSDSLFNEINKKCVS